MKKKSLIILWIAVVLVAASTVSFADTILTIGNGNPAISGFPGPYASVDIHLTDSTHATITFTSLTNSGNIYLMGDGGTAAVNVNASSWTIGSFSASNSGTGFTPGPLSDAGAGTEDGFGSFNQTVNSFDGFTHSSDTVSFVLTNTGGTWASSDNVLTPNAGGFEAAIHVFVTASPANASNGALATGFATNGSPVPEPASLFIWGTGLLSLTGALRKKLR